MLGSSFLPSRFRGAAKTETAAPPIWLNRKVTPLIQSLSRRACLHPIHTVVIVAFLASTTYIGLLESSLFDSVKSHGGKADWSSLLEGSRQLRVGSETGWKWQASDTEAPVPVNADHLALLTFVFPDSLAANSPQNAPLAETVPLPQNLSVSALPSTSNPLAPISQDSALAFEVPYSQAPEFLARSQELPNASPLPTDESSRHGFDAEILKEQKMWIMKAAKADATRGSVRHWAANAWTEFVDLIKNAETLDIIIMVLGYISMHLTFVSLFVSMRRMGSNFWLFATTLFSSVFAFLFGLIVTTKLGVPMNMVLLSEGLPFLVVTIGFEKAIVLTKAVLSAALDTRRPGPDSPKSGKVDKYGISSTSIQHAVQVAINEKGYEIVRDYAIEICILVAGAASGVQGGLQQFCFLAAWILFFDCVLLFTFYTAILSIKLEINRIKRHVALRQALEDDGVNTRVAEQVAQSDDWPKAEKDGSQTKTAASRNSRFSWSPVSSSSTFSISALFHSVVERAMPSHRQSLDFPAMVSQVS
jgi:hydroxymethylglutaryl-CoA reductase (NADPH)